LRFDDLRHTIIPELAEMKDLDPAMELANGHSSRRKLEYGFHSRLEARFLVLEHREADRSEGRGEWPGVAIQSAGEGLRRDELRRYLTNPSILLKNQSAERCPSG
jgi:hypothetical protein